MTGFDINAVLTGKLQRMHHVQRYSSIPVLFPENVAAHTGQICMLAYLIAHDLNSIPFDPMFRTNAHQVDLGLLMSKAVTHDLMSEVMSGDIIRSYKHSSEEIREACQAADQINVDLLASEIGGEAGSRAYFDWMRAKDGSLEGRIVALCDLLCVVAYCVQEHKAGNTLIDGVMHGMHEAVQPFLYTPLSQYVNDVFPNNRWDDPYRRETE